MSLNAFISWWNRLARQNGKLKFRNPREAADFVRRVRNENNGPNEKILRMRQQYKTAKRVLARWKEAGGEDE